ncbi:hypothetical protein [Devosia sp. SD17-2]|jgi:transcriptional regulator of acetoin/glycerol metabolism|uniref:hypothetical protein n=1 Tax=Devosia sp. SD17-2 TaxID=2976459 RepID=UPI0023D7F0C5|nr:hypothetical protein [Devosia sp. SD17-2]WEJ32739.1 hypothetical protein NYQ88_17940 [Devosia sp. SD17-2]
MTSTTVASLERALEIAGHVADSGTDVRDLQHEIRSALNSLRQGPPVINDLQLHARLNREIAKHGSMSKAAADWGVPRQTLHAVVNGDRPCPPVILAAIGLRRLPAGRALYREL